MPIRKIFDDLMQGMAAMKGRRENQKAKATLRAHRAHLTPLPKVDSRFIRETREQLRCSQAVFARRLRVNRRTLQEWEQGRAQPNPQAAALMLLVRNYPDTLARLERL